MYHRSYGRLGNSVIAEINEERMAKIKPAIKKVLGWVAALALADVFILAMSLTQIAVEGRTGSWSPFWSAQANFLINLLG